MEEKKKGGHGQGKIFCKDWGCSLVGVAVALTGDLGGVDALLRVYPRKEGIGCF